MQNAIVYNRSLMDLWSNTNQMPGRIAIALMTILTLGWLAPAQAADAATAIIIFDGSGSMWGRMSTVDRDTKFGVAREAIRRTLPKLAPQTRFGLAAFGHRRKADCNDTEIILAPEPLDADRIMAPLEKFNPKGKGPLVAAMREAGSALSKVAGAVSLVLIHDDPDNCSQDPCAAADELAKTNPKLAIHVISIALSKPDSQRMACVPRITGGRHFEAQDAAGLGAAVEDALKLASLESKPGSAATSAAAEPTLVEVAPPPPPVPVEDSSPPGMKLSATLGPGGPAVLVPLSWKVQRAGDPPGAPPVAAARAATLDIALAPGPYVVDVQHGLVAARQAVDVKEKGKSRLAIVLQAGAVRLSANLQKGMPPLEQAVFAIFDAATPQSQLRAVWTGGADAPPVFLPIGNYRVSGMFDRAKVERNIVVTPGAMIDLPLALGAGRLRVKAVEREAGPALDRVTFSLTEDDADSVDGRREVARSAAAEPEFTVSAGTFYLTARYGQVELRERVLVNAGDEVVRTLLLPIGRLGLQSRLAGSAAVLDSNLSYRIERLDAKQDAIQTVRAAPKLEIPAGRYRVESQLGAQNARVTREVEIKPGLPATLVLDHTAANIQLKVGGEGARAALGDVLWDVRDAQDRSVWQTVQAEPRAFLSPGRYKIVAESRSRRGRAEVEVKAGEVRVVEVIVE